LRQPTDPAHVHQWGAWTTTTAANCTTVGEETRTCTLDPTHTETEDGFKTRVCNHNNSHIDTEFSGEYATGTTGLAFELISDGVNNGTYRVRKGTVIEAIVHIPAMHRPNAASPYLPITEIGSLSDDTTNMAFGGSDGNENMTMTAIHIPASVTSIGSRAFQFCQALVTVTFAEGSALKSIGSSAFSYCSYIAEMYTPDKFY
jgi:hypothetical protein